MSITNLDSQKPKLVGFPAKQIATYNTDCYIISFYLRMFYFILFTDVLFFLWMFYLKMQCMIKNITAIQNFVTNNKYANAKQIAA